MRIPIWPEVRLSVWEKQNPEAVKVTLARSAPQQPVRRVLSVRGWMLLSVRYDWKGYSHPEPADVSANPVVDSLTRELHRRSTHLETLRSASEELVPMDQWVMVTGEVQGLRGALGIALGSQVAGGNADQLASEHYLAWVSEHALGGCRCELCLSVLAEAER